MRFREALRTGFHELQAARDQYRLAVGESNMNGPLLRRFIQVQVLLLSPFCPHWTDWVWTRLLKHPTSLRKASWPTAGPVDRELLEYVLFIPSDAGGEEGKGKGNAIVLI